MIMFIAASEQRRIENRIVALPVLLFEKSLASHNIGRALSNNDETCWKDSVLDESRWICSALTVRGEAS
jgi:hypothetical protein